MPHKRNPELCERVCGMARLLRGHAVTALENVAVWHERDISHSSAERLILPDAFIALDYMLDLLTGIWQDLDVSPEAMQRNLDMTHGLIYSGRVLLALVEAACRADAYQIVQDAARKASGRRGRAADRCWQPTRASQRR